MMTFLTLRAFQQQNELTLCKGVHVFEDDQAETGQNFMEVFWRGISIKWRHGPDEL